MYAAILVFLCLAVPGFGKLPAPVNVAMESLNLRNILRWSRPPGLGQHEDVTYTVEFKPIITEQSYIMACLTQDPYCDLTLVSHNSSVRVKAAVGGSESDWVTISFSPFIKSTGTLPPPSNVIMDSVNFRNILRWDRPPGLREDEDVLYIVQHKLDLELRDFMDWNVTHQQHCDLTAATYAFYARVKAAVGDKKSSWVTIRFDPYEETVIGPPKLLVTPSLGHLELSFSGPSLVDGDSIWSKYGELDYHVTYWKELDPSNVMTMNTSLNTAVLSDLEEWSSYCVKVQAYISDYKKSGDFSPVICRNTRDDGKTPTWQIMLAFLGTMVTVISVILGIYFLTNLTYRQYKSFPSYSIPQHLKEYLSTPFSSPPPLQTQLSGECVECNEQLTFISEEGEEPQTKEAPNANLLPYPPSP